MDGRLFGVINSKGKEVIPLKYDEVSFIIDKRLSNREQILYCFKQAIRMKIIY